MITQVWFAFFDEAPAGDMVGTEMLSAIDSAQSRLLGRG
jgi:hypothetical protein